MEYYVEKLISKSIDEKLAGRFLSYDNTEYNTLTYGISRWTWLPADATEEDATHVVVSGSFSFCTHYCPSDEQYSYDPGVRTYDCYITLKDISTGKNMTVNFDLDDMPHIE